MEKKGNNKKVARETLSIKLTDGKTGRTEQDLRDAHYEAYKRQAEYYRQLKKNSITNLKWTVATSVIIIASMIICVFNVVCK